MTSRRALVMAFFAVASVGFVLLTPTASPANSIDCSALNGKTLAVALSGFSECTIDDKTISSITVSPNLFSAVITFVNTPFNPGFDLTGLNFSVGPGQTASFDVGFTVTVNPGGNLINGAALSCVVCGATGDARLDINGTSNATNVVFFPTGPTSIGFTWDPTGAFTGSGTFTLTGNTGSIFLTDAQVRFSEVVPVPEPASAMLLGSALAGLVLLRRRAWSRNAQLSA